MAAEQQQLGRQQPPAAAPGQCHWVLLVAALQVAGLRLGLGQVQAGKRQGLWREVLQRGWVLGRWGSGRTTADSCC